MFLKCEKPITCHFRLSGIPLKKTFRKDSGQANSRPDGAAGMTTKKHYLYKRKIDIYHTNVSRSHINYCGRENPCSYSV